MGLRLSGLLWLIRNFWDLIPTLPENSRGYRGTYAGLFRVVRGLVQRLRRVSGFPKLGVPLYFGVPAIIRIMVFWGLLSCSPN